MDHLRISLLFPVWTPLPRPSSRLDIFLVWRSETSQLELNGFTLFKTYQHSKSAFFSLRIRKRSPKFSFSRIRNHRKYDRLRSNTHSFSQGLRNFSAEMRARVDCNVNWPNQSSVLQSYLIKIFTDVKKFKLNCLTLLLEQWRYKGFKNHFRLWLLVENASMERDKIMICDIMIVRKVPS